MRKQERKPDTTLDPTLDALRLAVAVAEAASACAASMQHVTESGRRKSSTAASVPPHSAAWGLGF